MSVDIVASLILTLFNDTFRQSARITVKTLLSSVGASEWGSVGFRLSFVLLPVCELPAL